MTLGVSALLVDKLSLSWIRVWRAVVQGQLQGAETRSITSPTDPPFLCPVRPRQVPLGPCIGVVMVVSYVSLGVSALLGDKLLLLGIRV